MNTRALWWIVGLGLGAAVGSACEVDNPDHCANQDQEGNDYCAGLNAATPYCSPCHAKNHGCLPFEPVSCQEYMGGTSDPTMPSMTTTMSGPPPTG